MTGGNTDISEEGGTCHIADEGVKDGKHSFIFLLMPL